MDDYFINIDLNTEAGRASYITEIARIKSSAQSPEGKLSLLDLLIKDFLRKRYHIKKNSEYSEMIDLFLEKKLPHLAIFCNDMIKNMYSGESIDQNTISILLDDAKAMIEKDLYGISSQEEKKGIFSAIFGKLKNKKPLPINAAPDKMSRQTEKIIEKTLLPETRIKIEEPEKQSKDEESENSDNLIESLRGQLKFSATNMVQQEVAATTIDDKDHPGIENIDNLERIKDKIKYRKIEVARKKQSALKLRRLAQN